MGNFEKRGEFGKQRFGDRDSGRPMMYHAICSDCGRDCEVPFKPAHGKPVYCNDCFRGNEDSRPGRFDRLDRSERRGFGKSGFGNKRMFEATCAECGKRCEVPFQPTGEKPVYCNDCFGGNRGNENRSPGKPNQSEEIFEQMNRKLDKIIKILEILVPKREFVIEKKEKETQIVEPKKEKKTAGSTKTSKAAKAKKGKKAKTKK